MSSINITINNIKKAAEYAEAELKRYKEQKASTKKSTYSTTKVGLVWQNVYGKMIRVPRATRVSYEEPARRF